MFLQCNQHQQHPGRWNINLYKLLLNLRGDTGWCDTAWCDHCVTSWAGKHLHQLVRHPALPHPVNQRLDVPKTVNGSKLQQRFPVALQSDFLEVPVPKKKKMHSKQIRFHNVAKCHGEPTQRVTGGLK